MHYLSFGGGNDKATHDVHSPTPTFQEGLRQFMKNSKAYFKIAGKNDTKQAVQAYQGRELLMEGLGIFVRAPAIRASLCVDPEISKIINSMLITTRKAKGKNGKDMIKGSSLPLPKHEPWSSILKNHQDARAAKGSPSIPTIIEKTRTALKIVWT